MDFVICLALLSTLLTLAVPAYTNAVTSAKETIATRDIARLQEEIDVFRAQTGALPASLHDLAEPVLLDPWSRPYHYASRSSPGAGAKVRGRLDKFLKPVNSEYDLFSYGPDGKSAPPLTAAVSRDDILRADNGRFVGQGREF